MRWEFRRDDDEPARRSGGAGGGGEGDDPQDRERRKRAAWWGWLIWWILLAVHAAFFAAAAIAAELTSGGWTGRGFGWAVGALAIAVVAGTYGRGEVFKRYWVGAFVEPRGYLIGHGLAWGLLIVAAGVAAGLCVWHEALWPTGVVLLVGLAMHALMWPRRVAMGGEV